MRLAETLLPTEEKGWQQKKRSKLLDHGIEMRQQHNTDPTQPAGGDLANLTRAEAGKTFFFF